jgi:predicted outer membrane repeat protein
MRLRHPEDGDYRPLEGSAAEAYGCRTFLADQKVEAAAHHSNQPPIGLLITGPCADVGGLISEDTTWDAGLIRVTESVEVAENATLTITPGTKVEFAGFFRLLVRGRLWAVGLPHNQIHFTAEAGQLEEGWDGIDFMNIPAANDSSRLEHCRLSYAVARPSKNGTTRAQTGGAVSIVGVNKLAIASCLFEHNQADYGAAIYCGYGSSPVIAGNLFQNNSAVLNGSVLFSVYAYPKLINNTLVGNTCLEESEFHLCAAVENFNGKIPLINNIIRDNFTNHHDQAQLVSNKDYYTLANNIEGYDGNDSNLDEDPGFVGAGDNPYQLMNGSICIDMGQDHTLASALADHDILGFDRVCGAGLDLGAYEYCGDFSPVAPAVSRPSLTCVPNPFNPRTRIIFELPHDSPVKLSVYDLKGHLVCTLVHSWKNAGRHEIPWNGCDESNRAQASGTYLYRLQTGHYAVSRTMTLVR